MRRIFIAYLNFPATLDYITNFIYLHLALRKKKVICILTNEVGEACVRSSTFKSRSSVLVILRES